MSKISLAFSACAMFISTISIICYSFNNSAVADYTTEYDSYSEYQRLVDQHIQDQESMSVIRNARVNTPLNIAPAEYIFFPTPYAIDDRYIRATVLEKGQQLDSSEMVISKAFLVMGKKNKEIKTHGFAIAWKELLKIFPTAQQDRPVYGSWQPYNEGIILSKAEPYKLSISKNFYTIVK